MPFSVKTFLEIIYSELFSQKFGTIYTFVFSLTIIIKNYTNCIRQYWLEFKYARVKYIFKVPNYQNSTGIIHLSWKTCICVSHVFSICLDFELTLQVSLVLVQELYFKKQNITLMFYLHWRDLAKSLEWQSNWILWIGCSIKCSYSLLITAKTHSTYSDGFKSLFSK